MVRTTWAGLIAGAMGTVTLNVATYADMAIRARSSSNAPSQLVDTIAKSLHLPLSPQGNSTNNQQVQNRKSGLGALLGYVNGLGTGVLYGLVRSRVETIPLPLAAIGVGLTAMAASDVPLIVTRVSNPQSWGLSDWASDIIPHVLYGLVTVATYETLQAEE